VCNTVLKERGWNAHVKTDKHYKNKLKMAAENILNDSVVVVDPPVPTKPKIM
jgi:hypothetical protein